MRSPEPNPPLGPRILLPENQCKAHHPTTQMLNSDLLMMEKFQQKSTPWQMPNAAPMMFPQKAVDEADIKALRDYVEGIETNIVVPNPTAKKEDPAETEKIEEEAFWKPKGFKGASFGSKDGGVSEEWSRGKREYLKSGYTLSNPNGTHKVDNDFGGKWDDKVTIASGSVEHKLWDVAAAQGTVGTPEGFGTAKGSVLASGGALDAGFTITQHGKDGVSPGLKAHASAKAEASMLKGGAETNKEALVGAQASGSAVAGDAEASAEFVAKPEQITLGGTLGAKFSLLEGSIGGDVSITPKRVANAGVSAWNWVFNDNVGKVEGEVWDIGIMVGADVSGQVGAQAGVEGRAGLEKGKLRAEAGAKIGLGLGVGVKARAGIVGFDQILGGVKSFAGKLWGG